MVCFDCEKKYGVINLNEAFIHKLLKLDENFTGSVQIIDAEWDGFRRVIRLSISGTDEKLYICSEGGAIPAIDYAVKK